MRKREQIQLRGMGLGYSWLFHFWHMNFRVLSNVYNKEVLFFSCTDPVAELGKENFYLGLGFISCTEERGSKKDRELSSIFSHAKEKKKVKKKNKRNVQNIKLNSFV